MRPLSAFFLSFLASACSGAANAQISDNLVRIGVLGDLSGVYADFGGPGNVVAARMAVEDAGGKVLGKPIDVVAADHQSKADVGAAIARQWFDADKVALAIGFDNSSVALAVEQVAFQKNRIAIAGAVATTAFTGKNWTPNEASWLHDSYALTNTLTRSVVARGEDTWFFITVDYTFGHSLEADTKNAVLASGGKVVGSARHPLNNPDFSSYLLQAQASGAKVVALANAGSDMINATGTSSDCPARVRPSCRYSFSSRISIAWDLRRRRAFDLLPDFTGTVMTKLAPGPNASSTGINACLLRGRPPSTPQFAVICARLRPRALTKRKRSWPKCAKYLSMISLQRTASSAKTGGSCTTCTSCK